MLFWLLSAVILKTVVSFSFELEYDNSVDLCIKNVIEEMFGKEDTIHFLIQDPLSYEAIYEVPNPKVIVSLNAMIPKGATNIGKNFLIQVDDGNSLEAALSYLEKSVIWNGTWSALGKFLLLTPEKNMSFVFKTLWSRYLIRSVVFSSEKYNATPIIYTSSPYLKENKCGMNPTKFDVHSCPNPSLKNAIKPVLTNYGGCVVEYVLNTLESNLDTKIEWWEYAKVLVRTLCIRSKILQRPFRIQPVDPPQNNRIRFIASISNPYDPRYQVSKVSVTENFVWLVPPAKRISPLKVYFIVFNYSVWISVVVCLLAVCLIWWVRTRDSFSHVLINVFSITLFASYPSVPKVTTLKLLLLLYIVYSVHIQAAYHSILFKVLTIPQYGSKIESLLELADSNLSIYTGPYIFKFYFSNNISDYPLYTKIKGQLIADTVKSETPLIILLKHQRSAEVCITYCITKIAPCHRGNDISICS
ncbi:hypothetical protein RI129_010704 [Pyrocoelia pectoralis]|uniref:Uncharacterized protein n=1 Tax=Pyrocoelia pectoralis TaxID=417401 RepID=A0AAN7ZI69_9COLE